MLRKLLSQKQVNVDILGNVKQKILAFASIFCFNGLMQFKAPKNDAKYAWTNHVVRKMMHYGLSADRVKRIIRNPARMEKGIVSETQAAMQTAGTKARPTEVWTMFAKRGNKKIIITAWRYPGISKIRDEIPIPADILQELQNIKY